MKNIMEIIYRIFPNLAKSSRNFRNRKKNIHFSVHYFIRLLNPWAAAAARSSRSRNRSGRSARGSLRQKKKRQEQNVMTAKRPASERRAAAAPSRHPIISMHVRRCRRIERSRKSDSKTSSTVRKEKIWNTSKSRKQLTKKRLTSSISITYGREAQWRRPCTRRCI